jgi:hypothetical protein
MPQREKYDEHQERDDGIIRLTSKAKKYSRIGATMGKEKKRDANVYIQKEKTHVTEWENPTSRDTVHKHQEYEKEKTCQIT